MSENSKTFSLVFAAAAVLLLAWISRPAAPVITNEEMVGKSLFPELDDPIKAKRMKIVTFDEGTSQAREFEVAQANGVWSLPSHKNYPADAKDQLATAATALVDLKVLSTVSSDARDHELYGVVEPKPAEDQFGKKGVGKLIVIEDEKSKPLARVIIGKEDKATRADDMGTSQTQLRFVRIPGRDQVYRVQMKTDKFSTKFADWIETDLLKLSPWDVAEIKLKDYSVIEGMTRDGQLAQMLNPRADIDLTFDDKSNQWTLKEMIEYKGKKKEEAKLSETEELNSTKLNDLKTALGSLKIMDVARKPAQMSANLKAGKDYIDDSAYADLKRRGFHAVPAANDQFDIVSNDGEAIVSMKDGVQYVLRFGEVAGIDSGAEDEKRKADAKSDASGKKSEAVAETTDASEKSAGDSADKKGGLSRYIMVMAQFNPDLLPKPDLQPLPEIKKTLEKPAATKGEPQDKKGVARTDAKKDAKKDDAKKEDAKKDDAKPVATASTDSDDQDAIEAERDRIEKENRRKQDEYDAKVKKGEQRVKELNARFADWYYVVGDETYRKIHLGESDIVKKKAPPETKDAAHTATPKNPFNVPGLPGAAGQN